VKHATSDPVGTALASIGAGASTGAAVVTAGLIVLRGVWGADAPAVPALFLPIVLFLGVATAVALGWTLSRPIDDYFRRGLTAAIAVGAALLLSGAAAPADMTAGIAGLAAYMLLLVGAVIWALLKWRRAASA